MTQSKTYKIFKKIVFFLISICIPLTLSGCMSLAVLGLLAGGSDLVKTKRNTQEKKNITRESHRRYIQSKIEMEIHKMMPNFLTTHWVIYKNYYLYSGDNITEIEKNYLIIVTKKFKKVTLILCDKKPDYYSKKHYLNLRKK